MDIVGTGGGVDDAIHKLNMSFNYYQEVTLEEARGLIVSVVTACLTEINANPKWRPYFTEYPVTEKTLDVRIYIKNPDYSELPLNAINAMSASKGSLEYKIILPGIAPIKTVHEEIYQEALAIVCSQGKAPSDVDCEGVQSVSRGIK